MKSGSNLWQLLENRTEWTKLVDPEASIGATGMLLTVLTGTERIYIFGTNSFYWHRQFFQSYLEYPACKRKRGSMDRQALNRINAQGQEVATIRNFLPVSFCRGCLQAFCLTEESVRGFICA